jgi:hypothetical protein
MKFKLEVYDEDRLMHSSEFFEMTKEDVILFAKYDHTLNNIFHTYGLKYQLVEEITFPSIIEIMDKIRVLDEKEKLEAEKRKKKELAKKEKILLNKEERDRKIYEKLKLQFESEVGKN